MSAGNFQEADIGWRVYLLRQQIDEWFEHTFRRPEAPVHAPDWQIPAWLTEAVFWLVLGSLAGWLLWQLLKLLNPYLAQLQLTRRPGDRLASAQTERLLTVAGWVERSRHARQQGNYREACRALYLAALQRLDDAGLVPQQSSRTDGEYLNLVQPLPKASAYRTLIDTHEQLCFGETALSLEDCDRCQQAYREIENP